MGKSPPAHRPTFFSQSQRTQVVGVHPHHFRDLYHLLLRSPWWVDVALICLLFCGANLLFAVGYLLVGGVANAKPGSFVDAFFFSVQTMGTIGYGAMYPTSIAAHVLVTLQALASIFLVALATGMIFAKFSVPKSRVLFSRQAVIHPLDGVPTLSFRIANERASYVVEAQVRVSLMRTERSKEGIILYRMRDLTLVRDRSPAFLRTWTVLHEITPDSPLHGRTPEALEAEDAQIIVTLTGIDGASSQTIHARYAYLTEDVRWGARHVDILTELEEDRLQLDFDRFHDVMPTEPQEGFPYPRPGQEPL